MPRLTPAEVAARQNFLGGSDAGDLLSLEPYGCARKLGAKKLGIVPDYAWDEDNPILERGHALEPVFANEYAQRTGRKTQIIHDHDAVGNKQGKALREKHPWFRVSIDRRALDDAGPRLVEIKSSMQWVFAQYRADGPSAAHVAQTQWGLGATGWDVSDLFVGWPDGWEFLNFEIERDQETIDALIDRGHVFWNGLLSAREVIEREGLRATEEGDQRWELLLPPLDDGAKQCKKCEYRRQCKTAQFSKDGPEVVDESSVTDLKGDGVLALAVADYVAASAAESKAKDAKDRAKKIIATQMSLADSEVCRAQGAKVFYRAGKPPMKFDLKDFRKQHPELAKEFTKPGTPSRTMRVYPERMDV